MISFSATSTNVFAGLLFSSALKGSLILVAALAAALAVRRAAARHQLLSLAMVGLLLLPLASLLLPRWELALLPAGTAERDPIFGGAPQAAADSAGTAQDAALHSQNAPGAAQSSAAAARAPQGLLLALYLSGLLLSLGRMGLAWRSGRRLLRQVQPLDAQEWRALVAQVSTQLALERRQPVQLYRSESCTVPLTLGVLRPLVLLPADVHSWSPQRRRLVLLHELAHIQRHDCLLQMLAQLACALYWFHPLTWLAERMMRRERELAADALVLAAGARPSAYAQELLDVARAMRAALPGEPVAGVAMAGHSRLEGRLLRILDPRADHRPPGRRFTLVASAAALALLLPLAALHGWAATGNSAAAAQTVQNLQAQARAQLGPQTGLAAPAGSELELTIDAHAQALVEAELDALNQQLSPAGAAIVALDPQSSAILAMGSRGGDGRNLAVEAALEPASTMKVFTVAAALENGAITPQQNIFCENGTMPTRSGVMRDVVARSNLTPGDILALSSNIGAVKIYRLLGRDGFLRMLHGLHFGERPQVLLPAAAGSPLLASWSDEQLEGIASGHGLTASPLQLAAAFAAVANHGLYNPPTLVRRLRGPDGALLWQPAPKPQQVMRAATADTVLAMLEGVVQRDDGTGTNARIPGYRVAGKTGTGASVSYFMGAVPASQPRLILLVAVDGPKKPASASGNAVAAPAFRHIAEQLLPRLLPAR